MLDLGKSDVLFDLCVQREYLVGNGKPPCINAAEVSQNTKHLMALARWAKLPVLSCVDVHRPRDIGRDFVHADEGSSPLTHMASFTVLPDHTIVDSDNFLCVPLDVLARHQQAIFTKVHRDPFTNAKLDRLLTEMPARRFVVFGIPLEGSLRLLVLGLLRRNRRVTVVADACGHWNDDEATMVLRQLDVKGAAVLNTEQFVQESLARVAARRPSPRVRNRRSVA
ncbi:MAG: isochorismatase family protein [Phycisphaerae bacterium]